MNISSPSPVIQLSKYSVMVDEKVKVEVEGLLPGQKVTVKTSFEEDGKLFGSCGHFIADHDGTVDTFRDESLGGTYSGVQPMGLFSSIRTAPGVEQSRLFKLDIMSPYYVTVSVHDGFTDFEKLDWSGKKTGLASRQLKRWFTAPGVNRIVVREQGLHGTLFLPPGDGPFPGILDLYGLWGGVLEVRSALLASHGLASFVLGFINCGDLPRSEADLELTYFLKAFDWLASHPKIDKNSLGGIAVCVGGGFLNFIASKRPQMRCLVSINSVLIPLGKRQVVEGEMVETYRIPYERAKYVDGEVVLREAVRPDDQLPPLSQAWRHGAKILFVCSLDDQAVSPLALEFFQASVPQESQGNIRYLTYPGAGHVLDPSYLPHCQRTYFRSLNASLIWGGNEKDHAYAQEHCWFEILTFFHKYLGSSR